MGKFTYKKWCFLFTFCSIDFKQLDDKIVGDNFDILFDGQEKVYAIKYQKAIGFNRLQEAKKLKIHFNNKLVTKIKVHP